MPAAGRRPTDGPQAALGRWLSRRLASKSLFDGLLRRTTGGSFAVTYWDGDTRTYGPGPPAFRLILRDHAVAARILRQPELGFGEAYMDGTVEVEGDLRELLRLAHLNRETLARSGLPHLFLRARGRPRPVSLAQQKHDVGHHYDLGNDFFALWLDETMSYSCAYFRSPADSLHQAQLQKIDHVLRKAQLRPGQTLLDIGSGWGWLIIRAAQRHGVSALGITLSEEQYAATRRRIREAGLEDRVEVQLADYRTLAQSGRTFDRVVSVGMFEHVGRANHRRYMEAVRRLLAPGGLSMLHTITYPVEAAANAWIDKYIFPNGDIPSLREVIALLPEYDFHILDVESLRLHYAMTLDRWAEGFERHADRVREMYGERFVRMWRLYLVSCAVSFRVSGLDIHQILFSKGLNNDLPLTREHLYQPG